MRYPKKLSSSIVKRKRWMKRESCGLWMKRNINLYLQYIEDNYVGGKTRTGYSNPRFLIAIWNHHQTALEMGQSTTNRNKGQNMILRAAIWTNSSVLQVIEGFCHLEAKTRAVRNEDVAQLPLGGQPYSQDIGHIVGPGSQRNKRRSARAFELRNIVQHRAEFSRVH
jgi:hypothetical protein